MIARRINRFRVIFDPPAAVNLGNRHLPNRRGSSMSLPVFTVRDETCPIGETIGLQTRKTPLVSPFSTDIDGSRFMRGDAHPHELGDRGVGDAPPVGDNRPGSLS